MKKLGLILVISILTMGLVLLSGGTALANFGPHGGYGSWDDVDADGAMTVNEVNPDSDACAGCHRAHTAVSSIAWTDNEGGVKNALLLGTASSTLKAFCYTCHSNAGSGAATNVEAGVYDNSELRLGDDNEDFGGKVGYAAGAESEYLGVLNGGGFADMGGVGANISSIHTVDGANGVAWGGIPNDHNGGTDMEMDCTSCHDMHGSTNYRILKDEVNDVTVGGFLGGEDSSFDPTPDPWVISNEVGYPTGGFGLHRNYADASQNPTGVSYAPDYTEARYAQPVGLDTDKGMSGWCAACHTEYNTVSSSGQGSYSVSDGYGATVRHRHPVNQPLNTFFGNRSLLLVDDDLEPLVTRGRNVPYADDLDIPLEHDVVTEAQGNAQTNTLDDYLGCLTCHRAHGSDAEMSGYANSITSIDPQPDSGGVTPTTQGVQPTMDSALLRADNRGVCERCHNK